MRASNNNYYIENEDDLPPGEQSGYRSGSRATKHQFLIDKAVLKDWKKKNTNLIMAWTN